MNTIPEVGSKIKVRAHNVLWPNRKSYFFDIPEFVVYEGTVYPHQKWQNQNVVNISSSLPYVSWNEISMKNIVEINGKKFKFKEVKSLSKTIQVKGSTGIMYSVSNNNGTKSCTCVGFKYYNRCKHLQSLK